MVKNLSASTGDEGSISGLGRSPGEGNGNSLQYSCLGNPMDRGAWWATVHGVAASDTSDLACKWTKTMFNLKSTYTFKTNFQFTRNTQPVLVCVCMLSCV